MRSVPDAFRAGLRSGTLHSAELLERRQRDDRRARFASLAQQVALLRSRWRPIDDRVASGIDALDAALGGGFARAAIHELIAPLPGSAAWSLAFRVAARAIVATRRVIFVNAHGDLYPPAVERLGLPLDRLIVVGARQAMDVLWTCEQALRCRAIAALIVPLGELDPYLSRRLQLAAEAGGGIGLLLRQPRESNGLEAHRTGPQPQHENCGIGGRTFAASRLLIEPMPAPPRERRVRVRVLRLREAPPGAVVTLDMPIGESA